MGNTDVRVLAVVLAAFGIALGIFVGAPALIGITCIVLIIAGYFLVEASKAPQGTSGGLGLAILSIGGSLSFLLPMWIAAWLRV